MDNEYLICRKEINKEVVLCRQHTEEIDLFKTIVQNDIYKIYKNGKDVTEKYKNKKIIKENTY